MQFFFLGIQGFCYLKALHMVLLENNIEEKGLGHSMQQLAYLAPFMNSFGNH